MPRRSPVSLSATAIVMMKSEHFAFEMKVLLPFSRHPPLMRTARIAIAPASDPAPASVSARQDFLSPAAYGNR